MLTKPAKPPLPSEPKQPEQPEADERKRSYVTSLSEYIWFMKRKEKKQRMSNPSWTHEKETSNALFVHGHHEKCKSPRPSDTFEVTLRGEETAIQALGRVEIKPLQKQFQSARRRRSLSNSIGETRAKMHAY